MNTTTFAKAARKARESAGLSRDAAGDMLGVTGRALFNYESEANQWPTDVVVAAAQAYKTPWLLPLYCQSACPIGAACPQIEIGADATETILDAHMYDKSKLDSALRELREILRDGIVTPDERERYNAGAQEIMKRDAQLRQLYYSAQSIAACGAD